MPKKLLPIKSIEEENIEEENLKKILFLLDQLFKREEATAKSIIGCLYDIATINLINKYIRLSCLNSCFKYLVRFPKPLAKTLGLKYYLQPQCPKLITDWLYTLVEFKEEEVEEAIVIEAEDIVQELLPEIKKGKQEIKLLRQKVRLLTGTLLITITVFGGSFAWMLHSLELNPRQFLPFYQSQSKKQ